MTNKELINKSRDNEDVKLARVSHFIDKLFLFLFIAYAIFWASLMLLVSKMVNDATIPYFIYILFLPLLIYITIKILIDMLQEIKVWKIGNLVLLVIATYLYIWTFSITRQDIIFEKTLFVYCGILLLLYTFISALINTIKNIKVWKILNIIFLVILICCHCYASILYHDRDIIIFKTLSSEIICFKNNKPIPC